MKQKRFEVLSNLVFSSELRLLQLEKESDGCRSYLHCVSLDPINFREFFERMGFVSLQWYHECWPTNYQLSPVYRNYIIFLTTSSRE